MVMGEMAAATDAELLECIRAGDEGAYAALFQRHYARVARHAARLTPTTADGDDIAALTFLHLWKRRGDVRVVEQSALPWLFVTAGNLSRNLLRAQLRYGRFLKRLHAELLSADVSDEADHTQAHDHIQHAFNRLGTRDREVLALCVIEDLSSREVASLLELSEGAVRTRLHRAKRRLAIEVGRREANAGYLGGAS